MRIDLIELLNSKELCHPTKINFMESTFERQFRIEVSGYPWWLGNSQTPSEGKICFHIEDIIEGCVGAEVICRDCSEEDLENLSANLLAEQEWAKGVQCEIFCSSPLADPFSLYAYLDDYLGSLSCPYSANKYLNMGHEKSFSNFRNITLEKRYLLSNAPEKICVVICEFLKGQKVDFNVIKSKDISGDFIYLTLGEGYFICGKAYATY
ncbi:MAG: hypothetical protein V7776_09905 [Halopseudomonas aestusnigri]